MKEQGEITIPAPELRGRIMVCSFILFWVMVIFVSVVRFGVNGLSALLVFFALILMACIFWSVCVSRGHHFASVSTSEDGRRSIVFGFSFFGHRFVRRSIILEKIEAVKWLREGNDRWRVYVLFNHGESEKCEVDQEKRDHKPVQDSYVVRRAIKNVDGAEGLRLALTSLLSASGVEFAQDQGATEIEESTQLLEELREFNSLLTEATPKVFITPIILAINVIVFALMILSGVGFLAPSTEGLIRWGADYGPLSLSGEWWRMFTSSFIHIGIIHILFNMWVLKAVGPLVERLFGNTLFLIIYLATGFVSSAASLIIHPDIVSAGASGAIFGLYGALVGYCIRQKHAIPKCVLRDLRKSSIAFIAYNVLYGFSTSFINNSAHLGGLACGGILGFVAAMPLDIETRRRLFSRRLFVTASAVAIIAMVACLSLPKTYSNIDALVELFAKEEKVANAAYLDNVTQLEDGRITDQEFADRVEVECFNRWLDMFEEIRAHKVSEASLFRTQYEFLYQVTNLRVQWLDMLVRGIRNNDETLVAKAMQTQIYTDDLINKVIAGTR